MHGTTVKIEKRGGYVKYFCGTYMCFLDMKWVKRIKDIRHIGKFHKKLILTMKAKNSR